MNPILQKLRRQKGCINDVLWAVYWFLSIFYMECMLQWSTSGVLGSGVGRMAAFTLVYACLLTLLTGFLSERAHFWVSLLLSVAMTILYESQMFYRLIFGTFYPVSAMVMGRNAIAVFWRETLSTMLNYWNWLLGLLVPLVVLILLRVFGKKKLFSRGGWLLPAGMLLVSLLLQVTAVQIMKVSDEGIYSDYAYYTSDRIATDGNVPRFGLLTTFRLELLGSGRVEEEEDNQTEYYIPETTENRQEESTSAGTIPDEEEPEPKYNVLDIDFDALNELTEDEQLLALNAYCANLTGTNQNAYTGMLSDYNLIVICAESFSTAAIDPQLTPTLYRLANEGIVFNNYYNSFPNTTTDGEYTLCQGLFPDSNRGKAASSMYASRESYLPFTLGNAFSSQRGITCYGYHNYEGYYYGRDESHPNMGYTMKFAGDGMEFSNAWPASDLEMMEQSVDDYISADTQFHAYYMTFSGHYQYNTVTNRIAAMNYDMVADLDYSEAAKCYLSCNLELEKALSYLMERLEEAGIADKTAIVMSGDHFPYGLSNQQYSELVGYEIDTFSKYKSTLIFWVGGLEEPIVVDEYCCNADVLPTILNLWGLSYDSRMLAGTDVFSDGQHMAILADQSFLTDKVWVNAATAEITYLVEESELPEGYVENLARLVETKFDVSADILNTAYYNFVFKQENLDINWNCW